MKRNPLAGLALGAVMAMLLGQGAMAYMPYDPEAELKGVGLACDAPALLSYLREGLPKELTSYGKALDARQRWSQYVDVVHALGKIQSRDAAPVLIGLLEGPLPKKLAADLELSLPDRERGRFTEFEQVNLQSSCTTALGQIGDPSAVPALTHYAERLLPLMKAQEQTPLHLAYTMAFRETCVALGRLGSTAGVALTMAALPDVPLDEPWAAYTLRKLTGQPFGPQAGHPAHIAREEYAKWTAWWTANKATYTVDPEAIAQRESVDDYIADMKTVRDYVHQAPLARFGTMQPALSRNGPEAAEWLTQNGPAHVTELAALVNDPDETVYVRNEAMVWYARFGGHKAIKTLTKYARCETPFAPEDKTLQDSMRKQALEIIKNTSPKLARKLEKEIDKKGPRTSGR